MVGISEATKDNVVRRALGCGDWFRASDFGAVASPAIASTILNELVKKGELEKRRCSRHSGKHSSVEYKWIN
jgi:hypothetical protein